MTAVLKLQRKEPLDLEDAILLSQLFGTVLKMAGRMPEALKPLHDFIGQHKKYTFEALAKGMQAV